MPNSVLLTASTLVVIAAVPSARPAEIFAIGAKNNSFAEFARRGKTGRAVLYKVGESSAERDWPAYSLARSIPA